MWTKIVIQERHGYPRRQNDVKTDHDCVNNGEIIRTQSLPFSDLHPSAPIQKSAEPLSMRMENSRAGVPT